MQTRTMTCRDQQHIKQPISKCVICILDKLFACGLTSVIVSTFFLRRRRRLLLLFKSIKRHSHLNSFWQVYYQILFIYRLVEVKKKQWNLIWCMHIEFLICMICVTRNKIFSLHLFCKVTDFFFFSFFLLINSSISKEQIWYIERSFILWNINYIM